jgi:hypothetical protein
LRTWTCRDNSKHNQRGVLLSLFTQCHLDLLTSPYTHHKTSYLSQALVAYACNPSYSGIRDQEDHSSKPGRTPYLKIHFTKIGLVEWLKVKALSSSPSTAKTNKQTKTSYLLFTAYHLTQSYWSYTIKFQTHF